MSFNLFDSARVAVLCLVFLGPVTVRGAVTCAPGARVLDAGEQGRTVLPALEFAPSPCRPGVLCEEGDETRDWLASGLYVESTAWPDGADAPGGRQQTDSPSARDALLPFATAPPGLS